MLRICIPHQVTKLSPSPSFTECTAEGPWAPGFIQATFRGASIVFLLVCVKVVAATTLGVIPWSTDTAPSERMSSRHVEGI